MVTQKTKVQRWKPAGTELYRVFWPVIFLTVIFFLHFVTRQLIGPLLPEIELELGLSHTQSGFFVLMMGIGFTISQLGAAFLAARWGYRRCILLSVLGSAAAAFFITQSETFWGLALGCLGVGVAGGLYVPSGIALITMLVQPKDWGKAMGIHELAPNLALLVVPFLATAAVILGSWRYGYLSAASVMAVLGLLYIKTGVDSDQRPTPPNFSRIREIVADPSFWKLCVLLSIAVGVETGVYSMIPLFLVTERGFELSDANQLLGFSRIPGIILVLVSGWLTDRLSPATAITIALGLTGVSVLGLGSGPDYIMIPSIFVQSAASACLFPPMLSMASTISSNENRALTLSLSIAAAPLVGSGLLPAGLAICGDMFSFEAGLAVTSLLIFSGIWIVRR
jgi:NNP family nitrate/nitrite transporter-like MFS transporter